MVAARKVEFQAVLLVFTAMNAAETIIVFPDVVQRPKIKFVKMKKCTLFLLVLFISNLAIFGQSKQANSKVILFVIDSSTGKGIGSSSVSLFSARTKLSKSATTGADGAGIFKDLSKDSYEIFVTSIGYNSKKEHFFLKDSIYIDTITLSQYSKELEGVVVQAQKPLIKLDIDKLTYEIDADPESKFLSLLDIMRKVPMLSVDGNENVKLKGSSNFRIFLNGRPSSMFASNPKEVLKSIPASSIQRIEVITNPPAKYDGEGLYGIINIVMNRRINDGYNGSVNLRYSIPSGPGSSINFSGKSGKFGLSITGIYVNFKVPSGNTENNIETFNLAKTYLSQQGTSEYKGHFVSPSAELTYNLDSLNLVSLGINYNNENNRNSSDLNSRLLDSLKKIKQAYDVMNDGMRKNRGFDMNVNYQRGFRKDKKQLLTTSYQYSKISEDFDNSVRTMNMYNYSSSDYLQYNDSWTTEHTFQVDYVTPVNKHLLVEMGVKSIFRNNSSESINKKIDISNTPLNNFRYFQNIYGVYNSYTYSIEKWSLKGGFRYEYNNEEDNFISQGAKFSHNYGILLPSLTLQNEIPKLGIVKFSYSRRVQRPNIYQLNPFIDLTNPNSIATGNPYLLPTINNNIELSYSKLGKARLFFSTAYTFSKNNIQNVSTFLNDSVILTKYENIGDYKTFNTNVSLNYNASKKLNLNLNTGLKYLWLAGIYNSQQVKNEGLQLNGTLNAGYTINDYWRVGLTLSGWTGDISLQGKGLNYLATTLNVSKEIFKKRANLSFRIINPYQRYSKFITTTTTSDFRQTNIYYYYSRRMSLSFFYRFGKLKGRINTNERGIRNDDLSPRKNQSGPM